jgi:hypothetical protein
MKNRSRAEEGIKVKAHVDYTQRNRGNERIMHKENQEHMVWKDRLRKEKQGFSEYALKSSSI